VSQGSESGLLLLPILTVMTFFIAFWFTYVSWCRSVYWQMRMDVAADAVALSAARQQAALLNEMADAQLAENVSLQKAKILSADVAHMQIAAKYEFEANNELLQSLEKKFGIITDAVAELVARANGANRPAISLEPTVHRLVPKTVHIFYFAGIVPRGHKRFKSAYFVRSWRPKVVHAQPPHVARWRVCHGSVCQDGAARLWLDVRPGDLANNGGFPPPNPSFLRGLGIQCGYPQFSARLLPKR
jgi:hypothetical protein